MYSNSNAGRYSDIQQYKSFEEAEDEIKEIANNPEAMKKLVDDFNKLTEWFVSHLNKEESITEKK